MDKITVIVPVYNVKEYLLQCVESITKQTYPNLEIILIDDGSSDGSEKICDECKNLDSRIIVIHQMNQGLSGARNTGIKNASGEYLCFVDSDDCVAPYYCERLWKVCNENQCQLAMCDYQEFEDGDYHIEYKRKLSNTIEIKTVNEVFHMLDKREERQYIEAVVAWNKLYARNLFDNIKFKENVLHEDEFIIGRILEQVEYVGIEKEALYYYRKRTNSITSQSRKSDLRHMDLIDAYLDRIQCTKKYAGTNLPMITWRNLMLAIIEFYFYYKEQKNYEVCKYLTKRYKDSYFRKDIPRAFRLRLKYFLFILCPRIYRLVFYVRPM